MRTIALFLVAAAVGVSPDSAAVGEEIVVQGSPGRAATLEPLEPGGATAPLGTIASDGRLRVAVPEVPHGSYRVVVAGESESAPLEVLPLSQETSALLLGLGALLVVGLIAAAWVVHRRWRDAVS
jgi:hypothetical protein